MSSLENEGVWADRDTDDINSLDSDELRESRPNRWRGPGVSWHKLTEGDRLTYTAFKNIRNQDLSIHLYNAFALKHRHKSAQIEDPSSRVLDVDKETGQAVGDNKDWVPPKGWTAWPMMPDSVPSDNFMTTADDGDDVFTFRRPATESATGPLEEMVSATILRLAKERFTKRRLAGKFDNHAEPPTEDDTRSESSARRRRSRSRRGYSSEEQETDLDALDSRGKSPTRKPDGYAPVVSAADDVSYDLLRPATRHILEKLDQTLSILHNARMAGMKYITESSATNTGGSQSEAEEPGTAGRSRSSGRAPGKRGRGRPRSRTPASTLSRQNSTGDGEPKAKRGRPRKHEPRKGESERDFQIRLARQQKKRMPVFSDEEDEALEAGAEEAEQKPKKPKKAAKTDIPRPGGNEREFQRRIAREGHKRLPVFSDDEDGIPDVGDKPQAEETSPAGPVHEVDATQISRRGVLERWALRDWSDVLGAAALAGFSPEVIARATQRCSNIFEQCMDMHSLAEAPAGSRSCRATTSYRPQNHVDTSASSDEDEGTLTIDQIRALSRRPSVALSDSNPDEEESESRRFFCSYPDCVWASKGFKRPTHLRRHMNLVHGQTKKESPQVEEESEGEMDGAVHVDGFLRPIKVQKGWRAEDHAPRRSKSRSQRRHSSDTDEEDSDDAGSEEAMAESSD